MTHGETNTPAVPKHINLSLYKNIPEVFDEAVSKYAHKKAFSNFSTTLTYSDLAKHVNQFALFLTMLNLRDRIAIQMPNVLQYPVVLFASLKVLHCCQHQPALHGLRNQTSI